MDHPEGGSLENFIICCHLYITSEIVEFSPEFDCTNAVNC